MSFQSQIADAVRKSLMSAQFTSRNLHDLSSGRVFWVMLTTKTNYGAFVKDHPAYKSGDGVVTVAAVYNTIDAAVGACTADQGDRIYVAEGHTETVTAANGLDLDIAGISVIGLGQGGNKATVNFTTAVSASTRINANSVRVENIRFTGGIDNITAAVTVNGKTDVTLKNVEFMDVTGQAAKWFHAANNSDRLTLSGCRVIGAADAGATHAWTFDGCDDLVLESLLIKGNFSTAAIGFITTLSARVDIRDFRIWNQNAADVCIVDTVTGSTGQIRNGYLTLTDNAANITEAITGATFHIDGDNVYVVNAVNEKAMLINWTASTDA